MPLQTHLMIAAPLQSLLEQSDALYERYGKPLEKTQRGKYIARLLLDSRVVDLSMAYTPTFVILSSLKPLFFNSLKNELHFSDNAGA